MNERKSYKQAILAIALMLLLVSPACSGVAITEAATEVVTEEAPEPKPEEVVYYDRTFDPMEASVALKENPQFEEGSFDFDGKEREYIIFLPKSYDGSVDYPLIIYLHSDVWDPEFEIFYNQLDQVAETQDFLIVYPRALGSFNSGVGDNPEHPTPNVDDVGFIDAMIDILGERNSIDLNKVYVTGWGGGGFMAHKLACQLSNRIAAIAVVDGLLSEGTAAACNPVRPVPILQVTGTEDYSVSYSGDPGWLSVEQTLNYWVENNQCSEVETSAFEDIYPDDNSTVEIIRHTNCSNDSDVILFSLVNAGWGWPGAPPNSISGNTNYDIKASEEIWNFFKEYELTTE